MHANGRSGGRGRAAVSFRGLPEIGTHGGGVEGAGGRIGSNGERGGAAGR